MGKRKKSPGDPFDAAVSSRLAGIGPYRIVADPGSCEIHFDEILPSTTGLGEFDVSWFLTGLGRKVPIPLEGLFEIWTRYAASHASLGDRYRHLLFELFSQSSQARYDERQWKLLRRDRPTGADLRSVVTSAEVRVHQDQEPNSEPKYRIEVHFGTMWSEHGVAVALLEGRGGFELGEWSGIG